MIKPRKAVREMEEYHPPTAGRANALRLDFNENTIGCSPAVIRTLRNVDRSMFAVYPEYRDLREALAKYCKVRPEEVIPINGTDEAIKLITETYIEKGRGEIVIPVPTYAMFTFYAQLNEAVIRRVLYNDDLSFPTKRVLAAITQKTKIVVLVNPNNPTGTSIRKKNVVAIARKAKNNGAIVLVDEAYCQFYGQTAIPLVKRFDNLFITQTFSKALGLAGLRLGYVISDEKNIAVIGKVLSPYSVNIFAALCAPAALKDIGYVKRYVSEVRESKFLIYKAFDKLGIRYYKSDANFVLLKIGKNSALFCRKMKERGILVRDRSNDPLLQGWVRVTLGTKAQTKLFIKNLYGVLEEMKPLLILDIDGVLVDVSRSYRVAIRKTAEYFTGKPVSSTQIQRYKNKGGLNNDWDLTEAIIRDQEVIISKDRIIKKFQEQYNRLKNNEKWLLNKGILKKLSQTSTLTILTGRPKREASYILKKNKVASYFKTVVTMEDVSKQKPNPEGLLKILKKLPSSDAYYFGDAVDDMKAAIAARITPVGVLPPQDKSPSLRNLLKKNGAFTVIRNINTITEMLP